MPSTIEPRTKHLIRLFDHLFIDLLTSVGQVSTI